MHKNDSTPGAFVSPFGVCVNGINNSALRILVADDDEGFVYLMSRILISAGYHVETVQDGEAAWEALTTRHFDLLITDHNMPKVTGLELIRRLRAVLVSLPCILVSGLLPAFSSELTALVQPCATVEKTFQLDKLLPKVRELLPEPPSPNSTNNFSEQGLMVVSSERKVDYGVLKEPTLRAV